MKSAVEWLVNEIDMQFPEINVKNKEWMIDQAKEMEEESKKDYDFYKSYWEVRNVKKCKLNNKNNE
jgi:hypothetical protein